MYLGFMITTEQAVDIRAILGEEVLSGLLRPPIDGDRAVLTEHSVQRCQERMACKDPVSAERLLRHLLGRAAGSHCRVLCREGRPPAREFLVDGIRLILATRSDTLLTVMRVGPNHPKRRTTRTPAVRVPRSGFDRAAA